MPQVLPPGSPRAFVSPSSRKGFDVYKSITNHIKINSNIFESFTGSFLELSEGKTAMRSSRVQPGASWLSCPGLFLKYLINRLALLRSAAFKVLRLPCDKAFSCPVTAANAYLINPFKSRSISRCVARGRVFLLLGI